ncbi:GNAT family N-acetyltransferase [Pedobacter polaris]|nr:GNAT family N-acetyltransferase [Pedobacter polaris]
MSHILDNPIYHALISGHSAFAKGKGNAKYYSTAVALFAGLKNNDDQDFETLYRHSPEESKFIVFSPIQLQIPAKWKLMNHIDMLQLVYEGKDIPKGEEKDYKDLSDHHVDEMIELVKLTQPGPFLARTIDFGNYTGVFKDEKLVAMAGHRFNPVPYTEISAVCTHPEHLGNGHAYHLLREQIKRILGKSEIPFLHVRNDNVGAIKLYEKIGFKIRKSMIAYVIQKA